MIRYCIAHTTARRAGITFSEVFPKFSFYWDTLRRIGVNNVDHFGLQDLTIEIKQLPPLRIILESFLDAELKAKGRVTQDYNPDETRYDGTMVYKGLEYYISVRDDTEAWIYQMFGMLEMVNDAIEAGATIHLDVYSENNSFQRQVLLVLGNKDSEMDISELFQAVCKRFAGMGRPVPENEHALGEEIKILLEKKLVEKTANTFRLTDKGRYASGF